MAKLSRSKEIWHIPKRCNVHQTIGIIHAIIKEGINNTKWSSGKQEKVSTWLGKYGATNSGKAITHQSVRTLLALPKYLGLIYINENTTPSTILVTEAGLNITKIHSPYPKINNLRRGRVITKSPVIKEQMIKLQITNPIILKDCKNIFVFPFRSTLRLLLDLNYLDIEELAYILFHMKREDEIELVKKKILHFRRMNPKDRKEIIKIYKKTELGQLTLVKAPTAAYYISLCEATGLCESIRIKPANKSQALTGIKLIKNTKNFKSNVKNVLDKFKDCKVYDFGNNVQLWIDYIGNPNRKFPPQDRKIKIDASFNFKCLVLVSQGDKDIDGDILILGKELKVPLFNNEEYNVKIIDVEQAKEVGNVKITPKKKEKEIIISAKNLTRAKKLDKNDYCKLILEHCQSRTFDNPYKKYLKLLQKIFKEEYGSPQLRGARLEYLFFKLLEILEKEGKIKEVIWNGNIKKYGLLNPAPGGKSGIPDITFRIGGQYYILELTTIKSKSAQWGAEGSSVPDHIRRFMAERKINNGIGIFAAPIQHERNVRSLVSNLKYDNISILCIEVDKFLNLLKTPNIKNSIDKTIKKQ